jgi:holin-like protein
MVIITGLMVLLIYQLLGEFLVLFFQVPIPGPVVGMMLLFCTLLLRRRTPAALDTTASGLLSHLSLLFVPAGVGVLVHWHRIQSEWLALTLALFISAIITLVVTALLMQILTRLFTQRGEGR